MYDDHGRHDLIKPNLRPWKAPVDYPVRIRVPVRVPRAVPVAEATPVAVPARVRVAVPQARPVPVPVAPSIRQRLPPAGSRTEHIAERNVAYRTREEAEAIRVQKAEVKAEERQAKEEKREVKATFREAAKQGRAAGRGVKQIAKGLEPTAAIKVGKRYRVLGPRFSEIARRNQPGRPAERVPTREYQPAPKSPYPRERGTKLVPGGEGRAKALDARQKEAEERRRYQRLKR